MKVPTKNTIPHVNSLLVALRFAGYSPTYIRSNDPQLEDDEITITDKISIQICSPSVYGSMCGFIVTAQTDPSTFSHGPLTKSISSVLTTIRKYS
jgi:hypothetical protein